MGHIKEKTIKVLFANSRNQCAFPGCQTPIIDSSGTVLGEICHIKAKSTGGPRFDYDIKADELHGEENLILLCAVHHKIIDDDPAAYDVSTLQSIKQSHVNSAPPSMETSSDLFCRLLLNRAEAAINVSKNSGNVAINSNGVTQGQVVNIRQSGGRVMVAPPADSIGADSDMTSYIAYLIKRYNEFASKEKSRTRAFSYGAISKNLEAELGCQWRLAKTSRFDQAVDYLIARISKTRLAKLNKAKGYRSFSTYDDHLKKLAQ